jgi:MerR family transcriptional regulator, light-induced transcriptional regulator
MARSGSKRAESGAQVPVDRGPTGRTPPTRTTSGADTDATSAGPSLTVAAVARRLGVAPATLRTWDRRYGLGPSEHLAGAHRRYSSADVARLLVMRRLTLEGVAPAEAARAALSADPTQGAQGGVPQAPSVTEVVDAYAHATPMAPDPPALVAAAGHFDNAAVRWMLSRVHPRDALAWWSDLVEPALLTLTGRVTLEGPGEHAAPALTAAAFAELRSRAAVSAARGAEDAEQASVAVPVVLALSTGRGSDLLVHVVATALQERWVRARVLSSTTPRAALEAVQRVRPAAVLVHVGGEDSDPALAAEVVRVLVEADESAPVFVQGDSGALDLPVAANVHRIRTLPGTLHEVVATVR